MKRNKFSLSHYKLLSCDMGELVPCGLVEVLPGDTLQQATSILLRVSPLLAPVMHPVQVRVHHWFVPHRLVWDEWEDFITGGPDGMSTPDFPVISLEDTVEAAVGGLADYLGCPTGVTQDVSALPFRGYDLIFNEWYRDEDLVTELPIAGGSGNDTLTATDLQNVAWEKDYFTSARPWTQKGPEVTLPLTGDAPVTGFGPNAAGTTPLTGGNAVETDGSTVPYPFYYDSQSKSLLLKASGSGVNASPELFADLSGVTAASINDLRLAFALQRYEEARARWGSRYVEYLRYLGVRSSDARLQRPEYLGGGKQTIQFSEVLQTGVTTDGDDTDGVGNLKGHGIAAVRSNRYRRYFEEHGYVFTLLSVRPKTMYLNGIPRTWNRRVKEDFWQKELEHIGQQEVLNKEIYAASTLPGGVFGYQDRYDEYRRQESMVSGEFRSSVLNFWHMARDFASAPALNSDFVTSTPTDRIYAAGSTQDVLWIMANHSIQGRRMVAHKGSSYIF